MEDRHRTRLGAQGGLTPPHPPQTPTPAPLTSCSPRPTLPNRTCISAIPSFAPRHQTADRDATYDHLNGIVPAEIKYELHVLLVQHGKDHKNGVGLLRQTLSTLEDPTLLVD